jgi:hypothetical protein
MLRVPRSGKKDKMKKEKGRFLKSAAASFLAIMGLAAAAWAMDGADLVRLKKGGVTDETLALLVREKSLETAAITVEEILSLKEAGLGEETLQAIISEGSFLKDGGPIVKGEQIRSIRFVTVEDIVTLKEAGVGDDVGRAVVEAGSQQTDERRRQEALDLLRDMKLRIDMREAP